MNTMTHMNFKRKLPIPKDIKAQYPITEELARIKAERDQMIADVFTGKSEKKILIIGPCSADREDAVLDYCSRLARLQETVAEKLILIPRKMTLHRVHSANATISEKNNVKSPLLARVSSIVTNTDRQKEFEDLLHKKKSLLEQVEDSRLKEEVPVQNLHLLRNTVSFLQLRIKQRKKNIFCRLFLSPFLLKGYFSYANGWRSFLRDLAGV